MNKLLAALAATAVGIVAATPAVATTGGVCFRIVNVPPGDQLNIRSAPSASSPIIARFLPDDAVILAKAGRCARWCRLSISTPNMTFKGWAHARYLKAGECP